MHSAPQLLLLCRIKVSVVKFTSAKCRSKCNVLVRGCKRDMCNRPYSWEILPLCTGLLTMCFAMWGSQAKLILKGFFLWHSHASLGWKKLTTSLSCHHRPSKASGLDAAVLTVENTDWLPLHYLGRWYITALAKLLLAGVVTGKSVDILQNSSNKDFGRRMRLWLTIVLL